MGDDLDEEESNYIPISDINQSLIPLDEAGTYTEASDILTDYLDCFRALPAGNDILSDLDESKIYYLYSIGTVIEGDITTGTFYLSDSFFSSLLGRKIECGGIITDGKMAITSCKMPERERILLSAGQVSIVNDTLHVSNDWETGMCVSLSAINDTELPVGVENGSPVFIEKVGSGEVKCIRDFGTYFKHKLGLYEGSSSPLSFDLTSEEDGYLEGYLAGTIPSLTHIRDSGSNIIFGGYTFTPYVGLMLYGNNLSDATEIRVGGIEVGSEDFTVIGVGSGVYHLDFTMPIYPYDALVDITVKCGGVWTNPIYYMFFSATDTEKFYLHHITPTASKDEGEVETVIDIYGYFNEDITDIESTYSIYIERQCVRNTKLVEGVTDTETVSITTGSVERVTDENGEDTPLVKMSFAYTPPEIEAVAGTQEVLQSLNEVYLLHTVDNNIASRNSLTFTNYVTGSNFQHISDITLPLGKDYLIPFGSNTSNNRVRIVMPDLNQSTVSFTVMDTNDQWSEVITGYRTRESIGDDSVNVVYATLPKKIAVGNAKISLLTDSLVSCSVPFLNTNSPVGFQVVTGNLSIDASSSQLVELSGYNLDAINRCFVEKTTTSTGDVSLVKCSNITF